MSAVMYNRYTLLLSSAGVVFVSAFRASAPSRVNFGPQHPTLTSKLGFSFTPGGLLFPYHLGVAQCLKHEGFLAVDSPLAGASAGALAAAVVGCGMDIDAASKLAGTVFEECRTGGAAFRLKDIVSRGLDSALPPDAHDILNNREGRVTIGITQLFPSPKGVFVHEFSSRRDLVEVLLGSCHVPLWFSSKPYMHVRGIPTVDGIFATPISQFGAPEIPSADQVVRITVFPTTSVAVHSENPGDVISPDYLDRYAKGRFFELLNYAVNPGDEAFIAELFAAGYESGGIWCERYGDIYRKRHEAEYGFSEVDSSLPRFTA